MKFVHLTHELSQCNSERVVASARPFSLQAFALATLLFATLFATPLISQVRQVALNEMVKSSGTILIGTITDVHGGTDQISNIVTYSTFDIEQAILGGGVSTLTIKQYGGVSGGLVMKPAHMRYFTSGEHVLTMLYPVSNPGYTSPIGMGQAVWPINGNMVMGVDPSIFSDVNPALLTKHGIVVSRSRTVDKTAFIALITELAAGKGRKSIPTGQSKKGGKK